jgi:hypothetical protein
VQGFVETIQQTVVTGWAYNLAEDAPVAIEVVIGGTIVATAVADLPRPDLERSSGRPVAGFRANLNLTPDMRAAFVPAMVRVYGLSEHQRHPISRLIDLREETPVERDEMGESFWMFGENLFPGLTVETGGSVDEIVAVTRAATADFRLTLKSGRVATVRPNEKITIVPEMFQDVAHG